MEYLPQDRSRSAADEAIDEVVRELLVHELKEWRQGCLDAGQRGRSDVAASPL